MKVSLFRYSLLLFTASCAMANVPVFEVVGQYDGSASGNTVDLDADYFESNSSGEGADASLTINIADFRAEIETAFSNRCGGVIGFDNGLIEGGTRTDQFRASFGEEKTLVITSVDHLRTDFVAPAICVPVSGPGEEPSGGFLAKSVVNGDQIKIRSSFDFTFTEENFAEREHIRAIGATILGRNGASESSMWLMKVRLDNGDIIAEMANINFRSGNARADTFFGARAPKGRYITGVTWLNLDGSHSGLDSLAFITNGAPPKRAEPREREQTDPGGFFGFEVGSNSSSGSEGTGDSYSLLFGREKP